ncbi:hypothetical protein SASPL_155688 [Salvia splendens]|uniref:CRIB domain-containing protein n=1 Tax=Salvia splendens TaxID=180675 RepID=A0A8X8YYS5_SALSN|nr:hypothetical protein SASPL_155688 [Salvia splendens]
MCLKMISSFQNGLFNTAFVQRRLSVSYRFSGKDINYRGVFPSFPRFQGKFFRIALGFLLFRQNLIFLLSSLSIIAVGLQQAKRSKMDMVQLPQAKRTKMRSNTRKMKKAYLVKFEEPSKPIGDSKIPEAVQESQELSQSFVYKDELEDTEMGMEIGLPTDVKHVTHIGLDGCASSILSKGWNNLTQSRYDHLPSFSSTPLQLAMAKNAENPTIRSLLEPNEENLLCK